MCYYSQTARGENKASREKGKKEIIKRPEQQKLNTLAPEKKILAAAKRAEKEAQKVNVDKNQKEAREQPNDDGYEAKKISKIK